MLEDLQRRVEAAAAYYFALPWWKRIRTKRPDIPTGRICAETHLCNDLRVAFGALGLCWSFPLLDAHIHEDSWRTRWSKKAHGLARRELLTSLFLYYRKKVEDDQAD